MEPLLQSNECFTLKLKSLCYIVSVQIGYVSLSVVPIEVMLP